MGMIMTSVCYASNSSSISLLDNRFRVDPSIEQITFVIYRAERSKPVVLVRPDGRKYYAQRSPDNVRWYQESAMDIVTIDNPMPGPWQAIGKVTPKNKIKLISHLKLSSQQLPNRLFEGEEIKFTARLTSDGQPLILRDFLDRVKLMVTFSKYVPDEENLSEEARPIPKLLGEFSDDGRGLDEYPGDGVFTVSLPIGTQPGKYRVRITSGNGVFLRAQEQVVLVYPTPIEASFIQSRKEDEPHHVIISGEQGMIIPGSIVTHIEHSRENGETQLVEGIAEPDSNKTDLLIANDGDYGHYTWDGKVYATEAGSKRPLYFPLKEKAYNVVKEIDLAEVKRMRELEELEQKKRLEQQRIIQLREEQRSRSMMFILIGNVVVLILGIVVWFVNRKIKAKKAAIPEMQLEMPKK